MTWAVQGQRTTLNGRRSFLILSIWYIFNYLVPSQSGPAKRLGFLSPFLESESAASSMLEVQSLKQEPRFESFAAKRFQTLEPKTYFAISFTGWSYSDVTHGHSRTEDQCRLLPSDVQRDICCPIMLFSMMLFGQWPITKLFGVSCEVLGTTEMCGWLSVVLATQWRPVE